MKSNLEDLLQRQFTGTVLMDGPKVERFSHDRSMYEVRPRAVLLPATSEDVVTAVLSAREAGLPLTTRGGGSGTAGGALGRGLLLVFIPRGGAFSAIGSLEEREGEPRMSAGAAVIHDELQEHLRAEGLFLPADPSSGPMCTIGGNVATKASGPHALLHGSIDRYLRHVQFVTADGHVIDTSDEGTIPPRLVEGLSSLRADILADEEVVATLRLRQGRKLASGYNLFAFLEPLPLPRLVAQLLVGSVGTLGVVTSAEVTAEPYIPGRATVCLPFRSLSEAGEAVAHLRELGVAAIEIISAATLAMLRQRRGNLPAPFRSEGHLLLIEFEAPDLAEQIQKVERLIASRGYDLAGHGETALDKEDQAAIWKARKTILPTLLGSADNLRALSVVNDVGVEPHQLAGLVEEVETIFARHRLVAAIYGHAGSGNLHLRPLFDVSSPDLRTTIRQVADEVYGAVLARGGTITAEHGMGPLRAPYLQAEWGEKVVELMRRVKRIFDPDDILNPGAMFSDRDITDDMRPFGPVPR